MGYSAKAVANYFLSKYGKEGIDPLKIQKLTYLAHGWYMAHYHDPLVDDEAPEVWKRGPVFPTLYQEFKHRGWRPILELATEWNDDMKLFAPRVSPNDIRTLKLLDKIWETYGDETGLQLSARCHIPDSPWDKARKENLGIRNANISQDSIRNYYCGLLDRSRNRD